MIAIAVDVPAKCACSGMYCRTFTNGHRKRKPFYNGYLCATANSLQATSLSPSHPCNNRFPVPKVTVRVVESFDCILFNWPINETLSPKKLQTGDSISLKKIRSLNNDTIIPVPRAILGCYIDRAGTWYQNLLSFLCQEARGSSHALKYGAASMLCDKRR